MRKSSTVTRSRRPRVSERRGATRVRPSRSARILDLSSNGIAIETAAPLEKGRVYDLILQLDERRMLVAARVVRQRRSEDAVRASLSFERLLESDRRQLEQTLVREVVERMTVIVR